MAKSRRALIEHRPWLLAAVFFALAYYFLWNNPIGGFWLIALKGAAVGSLAVYAWRRAPGVDGTIIAAVMALSAAADMAIELWFEIGGVLFALSHLAAIVLYLRNRRKRTLATQRMLAIVLLIATPAISYFLSGRLDVAGYGALLGLMAALAWTSRFPPYRVGVGTVLFIASDWLIFSRLGPINLAPLPDILVWPLYFAGQLMIATGVVQLLRGERVAR